jgi:hypothetical protein
VEAQKPSPSPELASSSGPPPGMVMASSRAVCTSTASFQGCGGRPGMACCGERSGVVMHVDVSERADDGLYG